MQVRVDQLEKHLAGTLAPCYLVFGDDPFLRQQQVELIRTTANKLGFDERIQLTQDKTFDWYSLQSHGQTQSLFSSQQLIQLELPDASPGKEGGAALQAFVQQQSSDQLLIITGPRVNKTTQSTKWFKTLEQHGVFVPVYTPERDKFPGYINQRARYHEVLLHESAVEQFSLWYEGNLLALEQELMKLKLQDPQRQSPWTAEEIEQASSDQSRYDIFTLRDTLVSGQLERYLHCLERLQEIGTEPVLILWTLHKLQSTLDRLARAIATRQPTQNIFRQERIWPQQQGEFERLARSYNPHLNFHLSALLERAEFAIKRGSGDNPVVLFAHFGIGLLRSQDIESLTAFAAH